MQLILKNRILIPISTVITALSNFLLIILLARQLPSEEYARIINIKALVLILSAFLSLGLSQSYIYHFAKFKICSQIENKQISLIIILAMVSSLIAMFWLWYSDLSLSYVFISYFFISIIFVTYMVNNEMVNFLRASIRFQEVSYFIIFRSCILLVTSLLFISYFDNHFVYLLGFLSAEIILMIFLMKHRNKSVNISSFPVGYFQYGLVHGLIIATTFLFNYIDKLTISISAKSLERVTEYDLATVLALSLFGLLGRTFNIFLFPTLSDIKSNEAHSLYIFRKSLRIYCVVSLAVAIILTYSTLSFTQFIFDADVSIWRDTLGYGIVGYHFLGASAIIATIMYVTGGTKRYLFVLLFSLALYLALILQNKISAGNVDIFEIPKFLFISAGSCCFLLTILNYKRLDKTIILLLLSPMLVFGESLWRIMF